MAKKGKVKYGYFARCTATGCTWPGELGRNERAAQKLFFLHAAEKHFETEPVQIKTKVVMEVIKTSDSSR